MRYHWGFALVPVHLGVVSRHLVQLHRKLHSAISYRSATAAPHSIGAKINHSHRSKKGQQRRESASVQRESISRVPSQVLRPQRIFHRCSRFVA